LEELTPKSWKNSARLHDDSSQKTEFSCHSSKNFKSLTNLPMFMRFTEEFTVAIRSSFLFVGGNAMTVHEPKFGSIQNLKKCMG
jgi:hypothetical protein